VTVAVKETKNLGFGVGPFGFPVEPLGGVLSPYPRSPRAERFRDEVSAVVSQQEAGFRALFL